jgi:hypothetical protein
LVVADSKLLLNTVLPIAQWDLQLQGMQEARLVELAAARKSSIVGELQVALVVVVVVDTHYMDTGFAVAVGDNVHSAELGMALSQELDPPE